MLHTLPLLPVPDSQIPIFELSRLYSSVTDLTETLNTPETLCVISSAKNLLTAAYGYSNADSIEHSSLSQLTTVARYLLPGISQHLLATLLELTSAPNYTSKNQTFIPRGVIHDIKSYNQTVETLKAIDFNSVFILAFKAPTDMLTHTVNGKTYYYQYTPPIFDFSAGDLYTHFLDTDTYSIQTVYSSFTSGDTDCYHFHEVHKHHYPDLYL